MTKVRSLGFVVLAIVVGGLATNAHAEFGLTVTHVTVAGKPAKSAPNVKVTIPNKKPTKRLVKNGVHFPSGTIFETPTETALTLESDNGNIIGINGKSMARLAASPHGESHTGFWGEIWFVVKNKLSFFGTRDSSGKFQAAVRSTEFSMEVLGKTVKFEQTKGKVVIKKDVRLKIGDERAGRDGNRKPDLTRTYTKELSANVREQVYKLDGHERNFEKFRSYEEAEAFFTGQMARGRQRGDSALVADSLTTLGYLVLEQGNLNQAIKFFDEALKIARELDPKMVNPALFRDLTGLGWAYLGSKNPAKTFRYFGEAFEIISGIDPEDPRVAEAQLALAEAWFEFGHKEKGTKAVSWAKGFLKFDISNNLHFLGEAMRSNDEERVRLLVLHIVDDFRDLGWAADLEGDAERRDEYYRKATALKAKLDTDQGLNFDSIYNFNYEN
jgi:tetratricopeptide (TPR) repeat protein